MQLAILSCNCLLKLLRNPISSALLPKPHISVDKLLAAADGLLATSTRFFAVLLLPCCSALLMLLLSLHLLFRCCLKSEYWLLRNEVNVSHLKLTALSEE